MQTIKRKALTAFTRFVPGYGQVHGDPNNKEAAEPSIPVSVVRELEEAGAIEKPAKAKKAPARKSGSKAKAKGGAKKPVAPKKETTPPAPASDAPPAE